MQRYRRPGAMSTIVYVTDSGRPPATYELLAVARRIGRRVRRRLRRLEHEQLDPHGRAFVRLADRRVYLGSRQPLDRPHELVLQLALERDAHVSPFLLAPCPDQRGL